MKKEIRKMYLRAIGKVLFALVMAALLFMVMKDADIEPVGVVVCSVLWGIAVLVYLIAGLSTIIRGAKQAKEYMENSHYSEMQLEEEYQSGQNFGRVRVGRVHVFSNASDQFYIISLANITKMRVSHHGRNRLGRSGYYYLRLTVDGIDKEIKVYYMSQKKAYETMDAIKVAIPVRSDSEA